MRWGIFGEAGSRLHLISLDVADSPLPRTPPPDRALPLLLPGRWRPALQISDALAFCYRYIPARTSEQLTEEEKLRKMCVQQLRRESSWLSINQSSLILKWCALNQERIYCTRSPTVTSVGIDSVVYGIVLNHRKQQDISDVHQEQLTTDPALISLSTLRVCVC